MPGWVYTLILPVINDPRAPVLGFQLSAADAACLVRLSLHGYMETLYLLTPLFTSHPSLSVLHSGGAREAISQLSDRFLAVRLVMSKLTITYLHVVPRLARI